MTDVSLTTDRPATRNPVWPPGESDRLSRVEELLRDNRPQEALRLLGSADTPWARNARGVCLMRLGRTSQAVETLRNLVFDPGGYGIRPDAHPTYQANYATALLLDGYTDGFWSFLGGIEGRSHPAVARLDDAVRRWKAGMTFWQRVASAVGLGGPRFALDFPPGDL
jgi:hypothetical protein